MASRSAAKPLHPATSRTYVTCQRSAGTLKGLLKIFEGLPNLRLKVIVARETKTP